MLRIGNLTVAFPRYEKYIESLRETFSRYWPAESVIVPRPEVEITLTPGMAKYRDRSYTVPWTSNCANALCRARVRAAKRKGNACFKGYFRLVQGGVHPDRRQ